MKTKMLTIMVLIAALAMMPVAENVHAWPPLPPSAPNFGLLDCIVIMVVVVVAGTVIVGVYKMCKTLDRNTHTNIYAGDGLAPQAQGNSPNFCLQSSPSGSGPFSTECSFNVTQVGLGVTLVASRGGVPVLTNSALLTFTNGEYTAKLDMSELGQILTNSTAGKFFRMTQ